MEGAGGIGGLLARSSGYSSSTGNWSTHYYSHADGNGNITYLTDASQNLAASYRYDPFGNTMSSSGTLAAANVYRFSSKEVHANSGMYYYGFRFYDPNLQRWINRDPAGESRFVNLYGFLDNHPSGYIDPFGLGVQPPTGPPLMPVPGDDKAKWVCKGMRSNRILWVPDRNVSGRSQPSCTWDPLGHWDLDDGLKHRQRYTCRGVPISGENAHANPQRKPKSGPGSAALLAITVGAAQGLEAEAQNGDFAQMLSAAKAGASGDDLDDMMFDAAVDAAIDTGNAAAVPGLYGVWHWLKSFFGK
jgi:RHS repeat-associated protein